jgi:hypothetical protein
MVDFISDTNLVRRLARNVLVADFSDAQIQNEQKAAYSYIIIKTNKSDWDTLPVTDKRGPAIQKAEAQLAAKYILEHYGSGTAEEMNWISYYDTQANNVLTAIIESGVTEEADIGTFIAVSNYGSYPGSLLDDPYAMPYRSTYEHL